MAKIKATHRLRRRHGVLYDPKAHFLGDDAPEAGKRVTLPAGTHVIPTEAQLSNLPDRFESLSTPEPPAEVEVDDDDDEDDDGEDDDPDDAPEGALEQSGADAAVDAALEAVSGEWSALTSTQLKELAVAYGLDVQGSGRGGNVLKADWIQAVQGARRAA